MNVLRLIFEPQKKWTSGTCGKNCFEIFPDYFVRGLSRKVGDLILSKLQSLQEKFRFL